MEIVEKIKAINAIRKATVDAIDEIYKGVGKIPYDESATINALLQEEEGRSESSQFYVRNRIPLITSFLRINDMAFHDTVPNTCSSNSRYLLTEFMTAVTNFPTAPEEGDLIGFLDDGRISGQVGLTINGNGFLIDGQSSLSITADTIRVHFYFFDGQWRYVKKSNIAQYKNGTFSNSFGSYRLTDDSITNHVLATPGKKMTLPIEVPDNFETEMVSISATPFSYADNTGFRINSPTSNAKTVFPRHVFTYLMGGFTGVKFGEQNFQVVGADIATRSFLCAVCVSATKAAQVAEQGISIARVLETGVPLYTKKIPIGSSNTHNTMVTSLSAIQLSETTMRYFVVRVDITSTASKSSKLYCFDLDIETGDFTTPIEIRSSTAAAEYFSTVTANKLSTGEVILALHCTPLTNSSNTTFNGSTLYVLRSIDDGLTVTHTYSVASSNAPRYGKTLITEEPNGLYVNISHSLAYSALLLKSDLSLYSSISIGSTSAPRTFYPNNALFPYGFYLQANSANTFGAVSLSGTFTTPMGNISIPATWGYNYHLILLDSETILILTPGAFAKIRYTGSTAPTLLESGSTDISVSNFIEYRQHLNEVYYGDNRSRSTGHETLYGFLVEPAETAIQFVINNFNLLGDEKLKPVSAEIISVRT